jgi:hypothetical protein
MQPATEQEQRDDVRRIQPANSSFPKSTEPNLRLDARGFGPGPLQVNTETGDDEEQKDADVAKRSSELDQSDWILKEIVWEGFLALRDRVIKDDAQRRRTSKRVDATQTIGQMRWGNVHLLR